MRNTIAWFIMASRRNKTREDASKCLIRMLLVILSLVATAGARAVAFELRIPKPRSIHWHVCYDFIFSVSTFVNLVATPLRVREHILRKPTWRRKTRATLNRNSSVYVHYKAALLFSGMKVLKYYKYSCAKTNTSLSEARLLVTLKKMGSWSVLFVSGPINTSVSTTR